MPDQASQIPTGGKSAPLVPKAHEPRVDKPLKVDLVRIQSRRYSPDERGLLNSTYVEFKRNKPRGAILAHSGFFYSDRVITEGIDGRTCFIN